MKNNRIDMLNLRFGKLVVISYSNTEFKRAFWICQCDCGNQKVVMGKYLRKLEVKSCGCLQRRPLHPKKLQYRPIKTYKSWSGMIQRCINPKNKKFQDYGGRGIKVCTRWLDFQNFLEDMGERPLNTTIDRIDNDGNYEPLNCRWATAKQQANNSRRNRKLFYRGESKNFCEWARQSGISPSTLHARLNSGWSVEKALTFPTTRKRNTKGIFLKQE